MSVKKNLFGTSWYQPKTINNFKHFDVQIFFLQCDKSNPNSIDDILLKKVAGYFFFHLLLMIGMLRQRFCCWRASHKIRHKQNKHIIEKTNKQNTKQIIFNFLILNVLNVITKSILVVLFIHDCLYLSTGKRISDSNNEFNAKKDAYCTKKWISF